MNAIAKGWIRESLVKILDEDEDEEGEDEVDEFTQTMYQASAYVMSPLTMEMESKRNNDNNTQATSRQKSGLLTQRVQITEIVSAKNLHIVVSDCQCTIPAYISSRSWSKLNGKRGRTTLSSILGAVINLTSYRFTATDVIHHSMLNNIKIMKKRQNKIPERPMVCLLIDDFELMGSEGSGQFGTNPLPFPCDAREKKVLSIACKNKTLIKKLCSKNKDNAFDEEGFNFPTFGNKQVPDAFEDSDLKRAISLAGPQWILSSSLRSTYQPDDDNNNNTDDDREDDDDDDDDDDFEIRSVSSHEEEKPEEDEEEKKQDEDEEEEEEEERYKRKRQLEQIEQIGHKATTKGTPQRGSTKKKRRVKDKKNEEDDDDNWLIYVTKKDNETLQGISEMDGAPTLDVLIKRNRDKYPTINSSSRLKIGTYIYITPIHEVDEKEKLEEEGEGQKEEEEEKEEDDDDDDDDDDDPDAFDKVEKSLISCADKIRECFSKISIPEPNSVISNNVERRISIVLNYYSGM